MKIIRRIEDLRSQVRDWRERRLRVGFVPTMGNLHGGHTSLVEEACARSDRVVVSIFVNPTQFGEGEDFASYPRTLEADRELLRDFPVDVVFAPEQREMYPDGVGPQTRVDVPGLTDILCGRSRPGHFSGVATVVSKLFGIVQPDLAVFGRKDFQQLKVIQCLVRDLNYPVQIVGADVVRDADGLAKSSRNAYLSAEERARAPVIYRALTEAATRLRDKGLAAVPEVETRGRSAIDAAGLGTEYFSVRRADDLMPPQPQDRELVVLAAARLGRARLIDNVGVSLARE
jgi:pantoate--beta-alanine ligase